MTRRAEQQSLDLGAMTHGRPGRVERRTAAAVAQAKREDRLGKLDDGMCALAVELARAVDIAGRKSDPYGVAAAARELREVARALQLDPTSRGATVDDPVTAFLAGLSSPEVGDPADAVTP